MMMIWDDDESSNDDVLVPPYPQSLSPQDIPKYQLIIQTCDDHWITWIKRKYVVPPRLSLAHT